MAKPKGSSGRNASDVWEEIDSTSNNIIGKRVFYQLTDQEYIEEYNITLDELEANRANIHRKAIALVSGNTDQKNAQGQKLNVLSVFSPVTGEAFGAVGPMDSSRQPGTFDLAKEGDLRD